MAAAGGGAPSLNFSNPVQTLIALAIVLVVLYAIYKFVT